MARLGLGAKGKVHRTKMGEITLFVDSFELLARALGQLGQDPAQPQWGRTLTRYGDVGAPVQLLIAEQHGHFDCVIGREVGRTLMPEVLAFWAAAQAGPQAQPLPLRPLPASTLWLGPKQGWLRVLDAPGDWLALRVLLHERPMPAQVGMEKQRLKHRELVDISNLEVDDTLLAADDRLGEPFLRDVAQSDDEELKPFAVEALRLKDGARTTH